jgi:hypothetical protein
MTSENRGAIQSQEWERYSSKPKVQSGIQRFLGGFERTASVSRCKAKKTSVAHVIAPAAMNSWLDYELCIKREWDWHPLIIDADPDDPTRRSQLRSDFRKDRIEVEVQFGNVARYAYDVYKMAISMAMG